MRTGSRSCSSRARPGAIASSAGDTAMKWILVLAALAGCAETTVGGVKARGPRTGPDDSDLWNVVPGDVESLIDVDLAALRASPWSQALMKGNLDGDRDERRRRFGYDVFTE